MKTVVYRRETAVKQKGNSREKEGKEKRNSRGRR